MKLSIFLSIFIGFFANLLAQNSPFTISNLPDSAISLRPYLQIYAAKSKEMPMEIVKKHLQAGDFTPFDKTTFKGMFESGKYAYWYYLEIYFLEKEAKRTILKDIGGGIKTVFHFHNQVLIDSFIVHIGDENVERKNSKFAYHKSDIPITLQTGKNKILIKNTFNTTYHPSHVKIKIVKEVLNISQAQKWHYLYFASNGIFFGILLFVLLFALVQYIQYRDNSFLFFALYVLSFFLVCSRQFGLGNGYFHFYPNWIFLQDFHTPFFLSIYVTFILFIRNFLQTKIILPRFDKVLKYILWGTLCYFIAERIAFYFIDTNLAYRMDKTFRPFFLSISIIAIFFLLKSKDTLVKYIGFGTLSLVVLTLLGSIITYGNTPQSWMSWEKAYTMSQIGILVELLFFSLALGYRTRMIEIEKNKTYLELQFKEKEAQKFKELDQLKDQFFTNITHEFRTPLTVIQGIAQQIKEQPTKEIDRRTNLIQSNTENLLHLVNQLLDISKADFQQYSVQNTQKDIIKYLRYLTDSFHSVAYAKKINLSFNSHLDQQVMDFDPEIVKTILTNLIGNALKFTPEFGKIKVVTSVITKDEASGFLKASISQAKVSDTSKIAGSFSNRLIANSYLALKVIDTGKGISANHLPYIFDRFYQADSADNKAVYGTGIGLALVKELVDLLDGIINVKSKEKEGSTFQLFLPIQHNAPLDNTIYDIMDWDKNGAAISDPKPTEIPIEAAISKLVNPSKTAQPLLLIIDDNVDVIYYLKSCLANQYQIITAKNGKEGVNLAFQHIPDIILSDVMMPKMDGFELCQQLKKDVRSSHIPIILLTAKVASESKYKGLKSGADAYLSKPFDKKELLLRLENLVLLKKQMQLHLQLNEHIGHPTTSGISPIAEKELTFLNRLQTTVKKELNNEFFKAPQLAKAMAMSQTQLYRKIKALTNQSTAQYIKTIRLAEAKKLLQTTDYSIGQIAVEVGFKTQAHFSKSFREEFGQNPSEIRKSLIIN